MDLASFESVRKAAKQIADLTSQIHYIFNNAGIMATKDFTKTVDKIEAQFAIKHVGHFLLTGLLLPLITKASTTAAASGDHSLPVRIINITSNGYIFQGVRFNDYNFQDGKEYDTWLGYGQAKSANIIVAKILSKKLQNFNATSFSVTPGLVLETNLQSTFDRDVWASIGEAYDKHGRVEISHRSKSPSLLPVAHPHLLGLHWTQHFPVLLVNISWTARSWMNRLSWIISRVVRLERSYGS